MLFSLLHEGIDDRLEDLSGLNLVNDKSIYRLVHEYLYPAYSEFPISEQFRIKESLRYGLNFWTEDKLYNLFPTTDAVFSIPEDTTAREFYKKIWDEMFAKEDITIHDPEIYEQT